MDKEQGIRKIRDIFENPFDYDKYASFSADLLKHIELTPTTRQAGSRIPDAFKSHIRLMKRVGKYKDPQGNMIDILVVWLNKGNSLERARTMQRNYIARYLDGSRGGQQKNAALTAFISPDENDWRFSFIKMEYELGRTQTGRLKGVEKFTPAKRYSFIVGSNESSHTAQSQLLDILCKDEDPALPEIENAFSIEKVTKEFFKRYKELFGRLKESLEEISANDAKIKENFAAQGVSIDDFAKKTLGQIVFLYFLQKKGWFGVERDADFGTGHKNFLRKLFNKEIVDYSNFFNDILESLFYNTLALKREHDYSDRFNCKIPFLNGGLFDPINDYDWVHTDIIIPNELFSNSEKTKEGDKGTGVLDVLDRYNFTVKEDEPLEKDVAVDPEMLGKVFENLLESKERKSKGSFYTPREIVHYMCQESLINHLDNELHGAVLREDIELLVRKGESIIENEYAVRARERKIQTDEPKKSTIKTKMPQSIRENAKALDNALEKIRVCDPAVGSGAFLVGMMNEIVKARRALAPVFEKISAGQRVQERVELIYKLKRHAIQNCLYGVDIDPGAVEIAKLRLWLSLVVDEEEYKNIQPLPNLNYKIMQGNSLLEEYEGVKLFDERMIEPAYTLKDQRQQFVDKQNNLQKEYFDLHSAGKLSGVRKAELESELKAVAHALRKIDKPSSAPDAPELFDKLNQAIKKAEELRALHKKFFEAYQRDEKKNLKEQIENIEWELIEATLKEQNKTKELSKLQKSRKENIKPYFLWKLNFEEVFREKDGFDIVIANPPYVSVKEISSQDKKTFGQVFETGKGRFNLFTLFLEKGHKLLRSDGVLTYILPEGLYSNVEYRFIREYLLNHSVILFVNLFSSRVFEAAVDTSVICLANKRGSNNLFPVIRDLKNSSFELSQKELSQLPFAIFPVRVTQRSKPVIDKLISNNFDKLEKIIEIQQGIIYSGLSKEKVFSNVPIDKTYKKILDGRDVLKWKINWEEKRENRFIHYSDKLHRPREERIFLAEEKILLPRRATRILAAYDEQQYYALNTAYLCLPKTDKINLKYVLACLNSKLINYFYSSLFFGWQITIPALNLIPISAQNASGQKPFIELVDKILALTNPPASPFDKGGKEGDYLPAHRRLGAGGENPSKQAKVKEYERQIDELVYKLYNLTTDEIKIIEDSS